MKKLFLIPAALFLSQAMITSCGEKKEEKKEEAPKEDTVAVVEEPKDTYEYKYEASVVDQQPRWMVMIANKDMTVDKIGATLGKDYGKIGKAVGKARAEEAPFAIYEGWTSPDAPFTMYSAVFVTDSTLKVKAPLELKKVPAGKAVKVTYFGDYSKTEQAHMDIAHFIEFNKMQIAGNPWEQYVTDPMMEKDTAKWQTDIFYPVIVSAGE
jgi:effector-binding domain-containing protein